MVVDIMTAATKEKVDVYAAVTDKVITALENGAVPWRKPWNSDGGLPLSLSTRKPYRGINVFLLGLESMANGYRSPWWGTYKIVKERGGQVRKGEHGAMVTFWTTYKTKDLDDNGKPIMRFMLRHYMVFNADQCDWPEGKEPKYATIATSREERIEAAEKIVAGYAHAPKIRRTGNAAFYKPGTDVVTVPPLKAYDVAEEFYSTLFHEVTHSTGHDSRLDRDGIRSGSFGYFGDAVYSKEELVAEMGAAMLCAFAGLETKVTLPNSVAYLASWIKVLKGDSRLIVQAAAQAQKAVDRILGTEFEADEE